MFTWEERFWQKVEKTNTCWLWTAATTNKGYGRFKLDGKLELPHRLSWVLVNGEIPKGLWVLHKCDTPRCVNPEHLFIGNRSDNMKDAYKKGRATPPKQQGEDLYNSVLTTKIVIEARRLHKEEGLGHAEIGRLYGIKRTTMRDAITGKQWKHVAVE